MPRPGRYHDLRQQPEAGGHEPDAVQDFKRDVFWLRTLERRAEELALHDAGRLALHYRDGHRCNDRPS